MDSRRIAVTLILSLVASFGQAVGQTAPNPTFTSRTELVLVPTIVTDHRGNHIAGLTKDDFTLLEDGKDQRIGSFEEIKPTGEPVPRLNASTSTLEFTNVRAPDFQPRRINIILLDALNTSFADQAYAREQLVSYLSNSLRSNELTTLLLLTSSGVKVIHDFTTDTRVLIAAVRRQKGTTAHMEGEDINLLTNQPRSGDNLDPRKVQIEADIIDQLIRHAQTMAVGHELNDAINETVDCMEAIAQAYAGIPGRKSLIWVTGGFPTMLDLFDPVVTAYQQRRARMFEDLNSANIAVYPVDVHGVVNPDFISANLSVAGGAFGWASSMDSNVYIQMDRLSTFRDVADMTGGRAFYNTNDLSGAIDRATGDSSAYYLLGFYIHPGERKPGWRKLTVKVNRKDARVRTRSRYFIPWPDKKPNEDRHRDVMNALYSPFEDTALPVAVKWTRQSQGEAGKTIVGFEIRLDAKNIVIDQSDRNHFSIDLVAVAATAELNVVGNLSQEYNQMMSPAVLARVREKGLTFQGQFNLAQGEYTAKIVVRDNLSGKIGSVRAPLRVE